MLKVFVYGTLKPGGRYHDRYCAADLVRAEGAIAPGKLYHLPQQGYPAMTQGDDWVQGYLLTFENSRVLTALDALEDYQPHRPSQENEYQRQEIIVFDPQKQPLGPAWAYLMESTRVMARGGLYLAQGYWLG
jgi:gamma-glutamylcyclotransferase (GGCT)/AIG2-like uncharacterized protein YtfP